MKIVDVAKTVYPDCDIKITGIRPGEKLHEVLVSAGDAHHTVEFDDYYVIQPAFPWWDKKAFESTNGGKMVSDEFEYGSANNTQWLTPEQLLEWIRASDSE